MSIITVEYPKPQADPKPKTLWEIHPKPWRMGESNESKCDILDAAGKRVGTLNGGSITAQVSPSLAANMMLSAVNLIDFANGVAECD